MKFKSHSRINIIHIPALDFSLVSGQNFTTTQVAQAIMTTKFQSLSILPKIYVCMLHNTYIRQSILAKTALRHCHSSFTRRDTYSCILQVTSIKTLLCVTMTEIIQAILDAGIASPCWLQPGTSKISARGSSIIIIHSLCLSCTLLSSACRLQSGNPVHLQQRDFQVSP